MKNEAKQLWDFAISVGMEHNLYVDWQTQKNAMPLKRKFLANKFLSLSLSDFPLPSPHELNNIAANTVHVWLQWRATQSFSNSSIKSNFCNFNRITNVSNETPHTHTQMHTHLYSEALTRKAPSAEPLYVCVWQAIRCGLLLIRINIVATFLGKQGECEEKKWKLIESINFVRVSC